MKGSPLLHIWASCCASCSFVPRIPLLSPDPADSRLLIVLIISFLIFSESHVRDLALVLNLNCLYFLYSMLQPAARTASGARQLEICKCLDATFSIFFRYPWLIHPVWANVGFLIAVCLESQQVPKPPSKGHSLFQEHLCLPWPLCPSLIPLRKLLSSIFQLKNYPLLQATLSYWFV